MIVLGSQTVEERPEISISRVELDCSSYHHQENWYSIVLPRLYKFARMVYKFRADDTLRWRYLLAGSVGVMIGKRGAVS